MRKSLIALLLFILFLLIFSSCGKNSPFSESYWVDSNVHDGHDSTTAEEEAKFAVTLVPLIEATINVTGSVKMSVDATAVKTETTLSEVPQSLMIGQRSITARTCAEVLAMSPSHQVPNNTGESKDISTTENSTREALIADLNQADPTNGDSLNLIGKQYVIRAYVSNQNIPGPEAAGLIPIACGTIVVDNSGDNGTSGGSSGGTTTGGTTTGGTTSGGGTTGGTVGGNIGGSTGTATGGF